ncbi:hypothetical protein Hanom_Chr04g00298851 [Helianthus anomalus]
MATLVAAVAAFEPLYYDDDDYRSEFDREKNMSKRQMVVVFGVTSGGCVILERTQMLGN